MFRLTTSHKVRHSCSLETLLLPPCCLRLWLDCLLFCSVFVYLAVPSVFEVCLYISGCAVLILKYVPERQLSN